MLVIEQYLDKLLDSLGKQEKVHPDDKQTYAVSLEDDLLVDIRDLNPGFHFYGRIRPVPENNLEVLFSGIMMGNLFVEGMGGGLVGLDNDSNMLTLAMAIPYRISYQAFRDRLEDFANYIVFWRDEITDIEEGKSSVLLP